MAAEYGININVRTKDEQLKRLQKELNKTDATVKKLANSLERIEKKVKQVVVDLVVLFLLKLLQKEKN